MPDPVLTPAQRVEYQLVEPDGQPYPPHSQPLRSREAAARRLDYYTSLNRATGEGRLPRLPLRIEWRIVTAGPWNGKRAGLDLVEPLPAGRARHEKEEAS